MDSNSATISSEGAFVQSETTTNSYKGYDKCRKQLIDILQSAHGSNKKLPYKYGDTAGYKTAKCTCAV